MKKLKKWLSDYFSPESFNDLDVDGIAQALNDSSVRHIWLTRTLAELKTINLDVDKRLVSGTNLQLTDLCARRKAYQDVLESILSARRTVVSGTQEQRPNPKAPVLVDLDRVTAY